MQILCQRFGTATRLRLCQRRFSPSAARFSAGLQPFTWTNKNNPITTTVGEDFCKENSCESAVPTATGGESPGEFEASTPAIWCDCRRRRSALRPTEKCQVLCGACRAGTASAETFRLHRALPPLQSKGRSPRAVRVPFRLRPVVYADGNEHVRTITEGAPLQSGARWEFGR